MLSTADSPFYNFEIYHFNDKCLWNQKFLLIAFKHKERAHRSIGTSFWIVEFYYIHWRPKFEFWCTQIHPGETEKSEHWEFIELDRYLKIHLRKLSFRLFYVHIRSPMIKIRNFGLKLHFKSLFTIPTPMGRIVTAVHYNRNHRREMLLPLTDFRRM